MGKQLKLFESINSKEESSKPAPNFKSERVKELQELVEYHQYLYYNEQPEISDEEFDLADLKPCFSSPINLNTPILFNR